MELLEAIRIVRDAAEAQRRALTAQSDYIGWAADRLPTGHAKSERVAAGLLLNVEARRIAQAVDVLEDAIERSGPRVVVE